VTQGVRQTTRRDGAVLEASLLLPVPLDRVFPFFADAENLEAVDEQVRVILVRVILE
jgi:hypothetical protein